MGSVQCRLDSPFCKALGGVLKGELQALARLLGDCAGAPPVAAIAVAGGSASVTVSCLGVGVVCIELLTSTAVMLPGEGPASAGDECRVTGEGQGSAGKAAGQEGLAGCRVTCGQRTICARRQAAAPARLALFYPVF